MKQPVRYYVDANLENKGVTFPGSLINETEDLIEVWEKHHHKNVEIVVTTDCGKFGYKRDPEPPTPREILTQTFKKEYRKNGYNADDALFKAMNAAGL